MCNVKVVFADEHGKSWQLSILCTLSWWIKFQKNIWLTWLLQTELVTSQRLMPTSGPKPLTIHFVALEKLAASTYSLNLWSETRGQVRITMTLFCDSLAVWIGLHRSMIHAYLRFTATKHHVSLAVAKQESCLLEVYCHKHFGGTKCFYF